MTATRAALVAASSENKQAECCGGTCSQESAQKREDRIRELAYLKWMAATGGAIVGDDQTRQFWVEAEKELDATGGAS